MSLWQRQEIQELLSEKFGAVGTERGGEEWLRVRFNPAARHDIPTFSVRVVDSLASRNHGTRCGSWMRRTPALLARNAPHASLSGNSARKRQNVVTNSTARFDNLVSL